MRFVKTRKVKSPTRGTPGSAGIDFYVPEDFSPVWVIPNESVLIPSGIKVEVPRGYALIFHEKSGICTKHGLTVGAKVVDDDYQGEVHLHLINSTQGSVLIEPGMKITQGLLISCLIDSLVEVESENLLWGGEKTERGEGGFGSTNNK